MAVSAAETQTTTVAAEVSLNHSDFEWYVIIFYFQLAHKSTYCTFHIWLFTIQPNNQNVVKLTSLRQYALAYNISPLNKGMWLWVIYPLTITFSDHWCHFWTSQIWFSGRRLPFQVQEFPETVSQVSPQVSTEAERPQQPRGTAVRPLWWISCSRCGKSGPSWQRRRKPSCPTRQKWKAHRWAGSPVPSGASLPSLHTSSPESPPCPCWTETRTSNRLKQGFRVSACNHMREWNPVVSLKIPQNLNTLIFLWQHKGSRKSQRPNLRCLLIPHRRYKARCVQVCSRGVGELWFYKRCSSFIYARQLSQHR